ncbi:MAG: response regulator, partial [Deltaproteobacteria bacterium]|nr:response regulator [Deltaproteobacteria bacterium]
MRTGSIGPFKLTLFILVAFGALALAGYWYVSGALNRQLDYRSQTEIALYQNALNFVFQAQESALRQAAMAVAFSFERADKSSSDRAANRSQANRQVQIFRSLASSFRAQPGIGDLFKSVYGYLDGNFVDEKGVIFGSFFNPKTALWLRGAFLTNGVFHAEPYIDQKSGQAVVAVSTVVYDQKGQSRGVVALDLSLDQILETVADYDLGPERYGLLADSSFTVLWSPNPQDIGQKLDSLPGLANIPDLLNRKGQARSAESLAAQSQGRAVFRRLDNGWIMGVVTGEAFYKNEALKTLLALLAVSLGAGALVALILLRMSFAGSKVSDQSQAQSQRLERLGREIRGPLSAMLGFGELAQREYAQALGLSYLTEIRWVGERLLGFCGDIWESDLDTRQRALGVTAYQIHGLLTDIFVKLGLELKDSPIQLVTDIDRTLPRGLIGDERAVRWIIWLLIYQAVQRTSQGFVKVSAQWREAGSGARLFFSVESSGAELTAEELANLFVDFERLAGLNIVAKSGLELSVAKGLCQMLDGDIAVESEPGQSLKLTAFFTQRISEPEPLGNLVDFSAVKALPKPFSLPGFPILAVDDIRSNLAIFKNLLEPYKPRLNLASNGLEALELARNIKFELLFIDHMMPEPDGVATLRAIRAVNEHYRNVPAIVFMAGSEPQIGEKLLSHGFDDYITKPLDAEKLAIILDRWAPLNVRRPGQEPRPTAEKPQEAKSLIDQLVYPGLDVKAGLERCGRDEDRFLKILAVFAQDAEQLKEALT